MTSDRWPPKDPDEEKDFQLDWTVELANLPAVGDTIASVLAWEISPPGSLVQDTSKPGGGQINTTTSTTIWVKGGTAGTDYTLTCRVQTAGGRKLELAGKLLVKNSGT